MTKELSYLALGDSYTVGEGVSAYHAFPTQLVQRLRQEGFPMQDPMIIAETGWTTNQLIKAIQNAGIKKETFDLVTLLIGVNNQYQGYPLETYEAEFTVLLIESIGLAGGRSKQVFVLSIPDYSNTPFAQDRDPNLVSSQIQQYNAVNYSIAQKFAVHYIDLTLITRQGLKDPTLLTTDALHPSGKMYSKWVDQIADQVVIALPT